MGDKYYENIALVSGKYENERKYWLNQLADLTQGVFPTDKPLVSVPTYQEINFLLPSSITELIHARAKGSEYAILMILLASVNYLQHIYTQNDDIMVVIPVFRQKSGESLLNYHLALRSQIDFENSFKEYLLNVKITLEDALKNQNYSVNWLFADLGYPTAAGKFPLTNILLLLENLHDPAYVNFEQFEVIWVFNHTSAGLGGKLIYCSSLFTEAMMENYLNHLLNFAGQALANPLKKLKELTILSLEEKTKILSEFNSTLAEYPVKKALTQIFAEQVEKTPDNIALYIDNESLSYRDLNQLSDKVAGYLQTKGVQKDMLVGLALYRSFEMIIGILGILKAGGAYLPINPDYPAERVGFILKDSGTKLLLTGNNFSGAENFSGEVLNLNTPVLYHHDFQVKKDVVTSDSLAYVIYTSGSTGQAKGVMIEHYSVINRLYWMQKKYPLSEADLILQKTPYTFDVSVWELFWWAFVGAGLVLLTPGGEKEPEIMVDVIAKHQITVMHFVPSMLSAFLDYLEKSQTIEKLKSLKHVFASGEALKVNQVEKFNSLLYEHNQTTLHNLYGPTEATVDVTYYDCSPWDEKLHTVPIGRAIDNITLYILDKHLHLLPIGVPGELYIAGDGVGRGYLNRPELTAERFILSPFKEGERLYKTGDQVKWLFDGNIAYLGRTDFQLKIRGFRIEPGEIEAAIGKYPSIKETIVLAKENENNKTLIAYFTAANMISGEDLRNFLHNLLPEYMLPAMFCQIPEIPLTPNGKVDRKKLSEFTIHPQERKITLPRNTDEEIMVKIWSDVLQIEPIGVEDNFFELAGDSIKGIQILGRARQYGINLKLKDLFNHKTIATLLAKTEYRSVEKVIAQTEVSGEVRFTPIQLWFLRQDLPDQHYFNQVNLFGLREDVSYGLLEQAITKLIQHHDVLRTILKEDGCTQYIQKTSDVNFKLKIVDLSTDNIEVQKVRLKAECEKLQNQLNLKQDLLISACVFELGKQGKRLFIAIHHLVIDGMSWRIFLEDLEMLYTSGLKADLPLKTTSYQEWAQKLWEYAEKENINTSYWEKINPEQLPSLITTEFVAKPLSDYQNIYFELTQQETEDLLSKVHYPYNTQIDEILLSALSLAVTEVFSLRQFLLTLEGHGREEIFADVDLSRTLGWFTCEYPVLLKAESGIEDIIIGVKENLRQIPNRGLNFGLARYLQKNQHLAKLNPEIVFNYLGQFGHSSTQKSKITPLLANCHENPGNAISSNNHTPYLISIDCGVINNKLQTALLYNARYLKTDQVEAMVQLYLKCLREIIRHCCAKKEQVFTPADFQLQEILRHEDVEFLQTHYPLTQVKIYPLTPMQAGMLFHSLYDQEGLSYTIQTCFELRGELELDYLKQAWQELILRHEALKTAFVWEKLSKPVQIIFQNVQSDFTQLDISNLSLASAKDYLEKYKMDDIKKGFDFTTGRLNRLSVIKYEVNKYLICWTYHHMLLDGWSAAEIIGQFLTFYKCLKEGQSLPAEPKGQFSHYLDWLHRQDITKGLKKWQEYLKDLHEPTFLPIKESNLPKRTMQICREEIIFSESITKQITTFCAEHNITVNVLFQTVFGILLQKYTDKCVSCFGMTVSGRPHNLPEVEQTIGLFINTLPVIIKSTAETVINDLLNEVNYQLVEMREYEYIPLADVQKLTPVTGNLFDAVIIFENFPISAAVQKEHDWGFQVSLSSNHEISNYDLTIAIVSGNQIVVQFAYYQGVFKPEAIKRLKTHLQYMLKTILEKPDSLVREISILSPDERQKLCESFSVSNEVFIPSHQTIPELILKQVALRPDALAVSCKDTSLTYEQLNKKANQLAHVLQTVGLQAGQIVGILLPRSLEIIISYLGILKAGGAYLPMDDKLPLQRLQYMLDDSGATILLSTADPELRLNFSGKVINLFDEQLFTGSEANLANVNKPDSLAYVIYTSGSTGNPKGVLIEHHGIVNLQHWFSQGVCVNSTDRIIQFASCSFDAAVSEVYMALFNGALLCIPPEEVIQNYKKFQDFLNINQISITTLPPFYLNNLEPDQIFTLKKVITAGSASHWELVNKWKDRVEYFNGYGPTECSICTTVWKYTPLHTDNQTVPIGKPIANTGVYVLDSRNNPVPIGIPGELCVYGANLSRGYLNRSELTAEKFPLDPFKPERCIYKTGDLVRWLEDGNLEYIGRKDEQVKIRSFRIEPGEIAACLKKAKGVKNAVVKPWADQTGEKYLCGYVVPLEKESISIPDLYLHLQKTLPDYMIPGYLLEIEEIPLTINGKPDLKALPKPDQNWAGIGTYLAPSDLLQAKLVQMWREILGKEQISISDNFFYLGGHSLKAMQLTARILKEYNVEISVREIFTYPTIKEIAEYIHRAEKIKFAAIDPVEEQEYYPVSSAQKRQYVLQQLDQESINYNMNLITLLDAGVDLGRVNTALTTLLKRHEALRTSFRIINGEVVQKIHPSLDFQVESGEISPESRAEVIAKFIRPFDLGKPPLFRAGLFKLDEKSLLIFDLHHIIADGISMNILIKEFQQIYTEIKLPDLAIQYKDYACWQNKSLNSEYLRSKEQYWLNTFAGEIPQLNLPIDYPRPAVRSFAGEHLNFSANEVLTNSLYTFAMGHNVTLFMALLAAYGLLIAKYTGEEDIIIGTPTSGRNYPGLENVIGMFVNTLALRNYPSGQKTFSEFLSEVKENTLKAFENQDYQFEILVEKLQLERDMSRNPLFDLLFVLQNTENRNEHQKNWSLHPVNYESKVARFDLVLEVIEIDSKLQFSLEYSTALFKPARMKKLTEHYLNLLQEIVSYPERTLADLEILSVEEKTRLLVEFNLNKVDYPTGLTVQKLFTRQVELFSEHLAAVGKNAKITYHELNCHANRLAKKLIEQGVHGNEIIAVLAEPSLEMLIAYLGILKAGAAYLPLDPENPHERISFILKDSKARLLLTQKHLASEITFSGEMIDVADLTHYQGNGADLPIFSTANDLAYVIYTSGSTGKPKGVMVEHSGLINLAWIFQTDLEISAQDKIVQFASPAFDASVWEIFMAFFTGAVLYIPERSVVKNYVDFTDFINIHEITIATLPPIYLTNLNPEMFPSLRMVITAGSASNPQLVRRWQDRVLYINAYGPTETTICATMWKFNILELQEQTVPIGRPNFNTRAYILDHYLKPVPIGVVGELCISGPGVARGYLHSENLTMEKFLADPYCPGARMYKTGDLARWLEDGNIEFIGRSDGQVKLRGYRIELGEIENQLLGHPLIKEVAVVANFEHSGEGFLTVYFTATGDFTEPEVREYLSEKLPAYMVPNYYQCLAVMPVTTSGKLNYHALPKVEKIRQMRHFPPTNWCQELLVKMYLEVLQVEQVGIRDNFFELGGDSLKAMQIAAKLYTKGYICQVKDILTKPTIETLASQIEFSRAVAAEQELITGEVLPAPIQKRVLQSGSYSYQKHNSIPVILGLKKTISVKILREAFSKLIEQHDALRLNYNPKIDRFYENEQHLSNEFVLPVHNLSHLSETKQDKQMKIQAEKLMSNFNLEEDLLLKACVFDLGNRGKYLFFTTHHLVSDPVSMGILLEDLHDFIFQLLKESQIKRPLKTTSYQTWTRVVDEYSRSEKLTREKAYWENVLAADFQLPVDFDRGADVVKAAGRVTEVLSVAETEILLTKAQGFFHTETQQLLITALALALQDFTENREVVIELENNGRQSLREDLIFTRTVGWFTSIYPQKIRLEEGAGLLQHLHQVQVQLNNVPDQGIGYGILKYCTQAGLPEIKPTKKVIFNYTGEIDRGLETELFKSVSLPLMNIFHPAMPLPAILTLSCFVAEKSMNFGLLYSKNKYHQKTIEAVLSNYLMYVRKFINLCQAKTQD